MERKERIKKLQQRNLRKLLYQEMCIVFKNLEINDFITLDETIDLQNKIITLMDNMDSDKVSMKTPIGESTHQDLLKVNLDVLHNHHKDKLIFYHMKSMEIGAIEINVGEAIDNIDYLLSVSEMCERGCSIFLVEKEMKFGLCLWVSEYDITVYKWGN